MASVPKAATKNWPAALRPLARPLDKIFPYPNNARTHPPEQIELLAKLMMAHGPDQPIVGDENGVILKGHGRRLGALAAGMTFYPYVERLGLSDAEKAAMRIADNQVALLAGWDRAIVQTEISNLKLAGYDLNLLGFGAAQLVHFETQPGPPAQFPAFGENIPTEFVCPACRHAWSGKPKPDAPAPQAPKQEPTRRRRKRK